MKASSSNGLVMAHRDLALKSAEIEELTDIYFFRPVGSVVAGAGKTVGLTPVGLTLIGTIIGVVGGALLYHERLGLLAFAILIVHSIVDSADGQLARMTNRVTELGRVLDGLSGYATHVAVYLAIGFGVVHRGGRESVLIWMLLAGIATAIHAGMYDYNRHIYIAVVTDARLPMHAPRTIPPPIRWIFLIYLGIQRWIIGTHADVEAALAERSVDGRVRDEDRARYREIFYSLVRGWNFLGDNTRFFAIGVLALLHRIDLFFAFVLVLMNAAFVVLWLWQRSADRRFLAALSSSKLPAE
ncbi:MAG TPA: CDP-alcohol phosphatidyltransferase family protein [Chthoniobacterales bacterium]|nr:CDP-alcohol phosphatidyltransferase family protein [Chthoniobacterales bacterium]